METKLPENHHPNCHTYYCLSVYYWFLVCWDSIYVKSYCKFHLLCVIYTQKHPLFVPVIGTSVWRCSRSPLGGRLSTMLVDCYFHTHFPYFPIPFYFFCRNFFSQGARVKKPIQQKLFQAGHKGRASIGFKVSLGPSMDSA